MINNNCSLHLFNIEDINVEDILARLSQCQFYSLKKNSLSLKTLKRMITKNDAADVKMSKVLTFLMNTKDCVVKFYVFIKPNHISIYSDFFDSIDTFDLAKRFFEDLPIIVVSISIAETTSFIDIRKKRKKQCYKFESNLNKTVFFDSFSTSNLAISLDALYKVWEEEVKLKKYSLQEKSSFFSQCTIIEEFII